MDDRENGGSGFGPSAHRETPERSSKLVQRSADPPGHHETRTLEFPTDRSHGTLYIGDAVSLAEHFMQAHGERDLLPIEILDARGRITIENNKHVLLESGAQAPDLSHLRNLSSDALWGVSTGKGSAGLTDIELGDLAGLMGLQYLNLYVPEVTDAGMAQLAGMVNLKSLTLVGAWRITDSGIGSIARIKGLERLTLYNVTVDDAGLALLADLTRLRWLFLTNSWVTDDGFAHFSRMAGLESLILSFTADWARFADAGFTHLRSATALRHLGLWDTNTSDEGLAHLSQLTGLEGLDLGGDRQRITDSGLAYFRELVDLKSLSLSDTKISDAGLLHLVALTSLEELHLDGTLVTDAGLVHLLGLANLKRLTLTGTSVTEAGLAQLKGLGNLARPIPRGSR